MTFLPENTYSRPVEGNLQADLCIVGDVPSAQAIRERRPFAGPQETVLQEVLHQAGLIRPDVCTTNLIYDNPKIEQYWREGGAKGPSQLKGDISGYRQSLADFLSEVQPKVVVALGELTMFAFLGRSRITELRGYPFKTEKMNLWVVPSLHPSKMIWTNYQWRYYLAHDLKKAVKISRNPNFSYPETDIYVPRTLAETLAILDMLKKHKRLSMDLEVSNFQVSCIGFAYKPLSGISIPIDMRWNEFEELQIWIALAQLLEDPTKIWIGQNIIFDIQFLAQQNGIFVKGKIEDTMTGHHIMFPDFLKGLGFLASVHTLHPYWKDELDVKGIKVDD